MWVAIVVAVIGAISGAVQSINSRKSAKKAQELQEQQLALMREQVRQYELLRANLPKQTRAMLDDLNKSYAEVTMLLNHAKERGDEQSAALFEAQRDLVRSHMSAELTMVDANADEFMGLTDELAGSAVELVTSDADFNEGLQGVYKEQTDAALGTLRQMAEASEKRVGNILETGVSAEAAAKLSEMHQGISDLTRKTKDLEARVGKGGAASRITATELEGLKVIGQVTADLQRAGQEELSKAGSTQQQFLTAAEQRLGALKTTRGRDELAARQPYDQAQLQNLQLTQQQKLNALSSANVETRRLTGAEGEASIAREDEFARDRMSLVLNRAASEQALKEREQDLNFQAVARTVGTATSMADVMGVQAQNYANMAKESSAAAQKSFASSVTKLAEGAEIKWGTPTAAQAATGATADTKPTAAAAAAGATP